MAVLLNPQEVREKLMSSKGWELTSAGEIQKKFTFGNFQEALDFVNRVGALAEGMDHHPDISLHGYKNVTLTLTTHSAAVPVGGEAKDAEGRKVTGLTRMDFDLAAKIENAFQ